jgi:hypothetical protein
MAKGTNGVCISVEQAALKTCSVTIQALTVNSRQVTLAVFRQLKEEPVIVGDPPALAGRVWGLVNYHWAECKDAGATPRMRQGGYNRGVKNCQY